MCYNFLERHRIVVNPVSHSNHTIICFPAGTWDSKATGESYNHVRIAERCFPMILYSSTILVIQKNSKDSYINHRF